jgi:hypothetical protein
VKVVLYYKAIIAGDQTNSQANFEAASAALQTNTDRIRFLTSDDGILKTSATKITVLAPALSKAGSDIKGKVQAIESDIRKSINLNPMDLIDAMATVATAPI